MISLDQKSRFLTLGPCSSGGTALLWTGREKKSSQISISKKPFVVRRQTPEEQRGCWSRRIFQGLASRGTYRICLILSVVQIMTVVENVFVGGVEAGFYAILHHLTCPRGALEFLDLNTTDIEIIFLIPSKI